MMQPHIIAMDAQRPAAGLSIVELMVGITVGLFVLAAASMVATTQLNDNRRLLLEAQIQQDLRIASQLIERDLRRAAYWGHSSWAVAPATMASAVANPYVCINPASSTASATDVTFARSFDYDNKLRTYENDRVDVKDTSGFRFDADHGRIEIKLESGSYQVLTDENVLQITDFWIDLNSTDIQVPCGEVCPVTTSASGVQLPLIQRLRTATIVIKGRATADHQVQRSVQSTLRLRNDIVMVSECSAPGV